MLRLELVAEAGQVAVTGLAAAVGAKVSLVVVWLPVVVVIMGDGCCV